MLPDIRTGRAALEERCRPSLESHKMASQRFCLRWNNHQSNLLSVFDQLLQEQCFVDVTLAVEGKFLRAHKMVLSACSPYFQTLFTEHPDKHPIVILKDVPYADMRCLLDFMYRGEVSVNQDRLTAFLKVAETLRIKGLTEVNEERGSSVANSSSSSLNSSLQLPPPQLHRINRVQPSHPYNQHPMPGAAPLLGSALTAPKRKRGRPRKLSGSSEMEPDSDSERGADSGLNLPELLEVNMDDGRDERCSNGGTDGDREGDMDIEEEQIGSSPSVPSQRHNPFQLEDLLKPKMERRSSEESLTFDYSSIKREPDSPYSGGNNLNTSGYGGSGGGGGGDTGPPTPTSTASPNNQHKTAVRRRMRRRANSSSQDPAEQLTEMSVRGLNLFRYASIQEGLYKCTECEKMEVMKTFKNKYSFQRHAFLYHEGHQRKVFPCTVCQKEFSRPDKMKNHMKTVHGSDLAKELFSPGGGVTLGSVPFFMAPPSLQVHALGHKPPSPKMAPSPGPIAPTSVP